VGVEIVPLIAQCLDVPLVTRNIQGGSLNQELYYCEETKESQDEVEDLFELLSEVKQKHPEV
jgi:diphthine-ammonia ligase